MVSKVANARMYSVTPEVKAAWNALLALALQKAGLPWTVIDYDAPAPLSALWARDDLGLAMMCGLPFSQRSPRPILVAAPIPSPMRYGGKPIYFTDIVVRVDSPFLGLADTFGSIVGYTLADSMSGGVALRDHVAAARGARQGRLYRKAVGNLIHARGVIEALAAGKIDVGPLDSYYHDLLKRNDPALAAKVRVIDTTAARPIPPLVATVSLTDDELGRLRVALVEAVLDERLHAVADQLQLRGFAFPDPSDYDILSAIAARQTPAFEAL